MILFVRKENAGSQLKLTKGPMLLFILDNYIWSGDSY